MSTMRMKTRPSNAPDAVGRRSCHGHLWRWRASPAAADDVVPVAEAAAAATPLTFSYAGDSQTYTVPTDGSVCFAAISAAGANGGDAALLSQTVTAPGGVGGNAHGVFALTPGDTVTIDVGGRGANGGQAATGSGGGFGGGADGGSGAAGGGVAEGGGSGGGGATTVSDGTSLLLVAGGGGGAGTLTSAGGTGGAGGAGGGNGSGAASPGSTGAGGAGGTTSAGGAGGAAGGDDATDGAAGTAGDGGVGGDGASIGLNGGGGGGGGGVFGGGGGGGATEGSAGGGGGGGAGFVSPDAVSVIDLPGSATQDGAGNGSVTISTASCALIGVTKQLVNTARDGSTFTVHVVCTSVSADLTFDQQGEPIEGDVIEARPGDTCTVSETASGGAISTSYACESLIGPATCSADGRSVTFSSALEAQAVSVDVVNTFAVMLQPRFTG